MGELIYGTSSWSEPSWVGCFYPRGLPQGQWLEHYATRLRSVEADVTYYRIPTKRMVEGWARRTPPNFVLSAKFPRAVVHAGQTAIPDADVLLRPKVVGDGCLAFLDAMSLLGEKCGPLVLQFPYFNKRVFDSPDAFLERLDEFLGWLPDAFRYGVEIRNRWWLKPPLMGVLRRHRTALVLTDLNYMPHPAEVAEKLDVLTTDFLYGRLIGDRKAMDALTERFDQVVIPRRDRLVEWATLLSDQAHRFERAFVYANNHYEGHAPATVAALMRLTGREEEARLLEQGPEGKDAIGARELPFD